MLADQSAGKFKKTITDICKSVSSGSSLSEALGRYPRVFSVYFVNCAKSGEQSGRLEENLADIAQKLKKDKETAAKIKSAMAYPLIVVIGGLGLAFLIAYIVLPKIVPLFIGLKVQLPLSTRILIRISGVLETNELRIPGYLRSRTGFSRFYLELGAFTACQGHGSSSVFLSSESLSDARIWRRSRGRPVHCYGPGYPSTKRLRFPGRYQRTTITSKASGRFSKKPHREEGWRITSGFFRVVSLSDPRSCHGRRKIRQSGRSPFVRSRSLRG